MSTLREKLEEMKANASDLRKDVIDTILDSTGDDDEVVSYIRDVTTHGCKSGIVGSLIYYSDTHKYFDTHYGDIMSLLEEMNAETGRYPDMNGDLKNTYAWFAFEEACYRIGVDLGIL